ncbi:hypothetical protein SARC_07154 [Sphaeroforma arctica JP610]|uniref:Uncharacterized protein n=1 Tax=Sphaeroforma arctica JP610 TaxID=667725 RepID=A0A0L0FX04_9EUKA|nr:hypothetical protein SARC_07154 [Sphaeroforma arctica JP610]KNC80493.1 hypothetical protein SARC_07154 [Sphaeroforma arctica JP610]|eukprot:XP_014154395.1 hypothetical protein SARC_07154 [Sphaeroforma arctica JP610]
MEPTRISKLTEENTELKNQLAALKQNVTSREKVVVKNPRDQIDQGYVSRQTSNEKPPQTRPRDSVQNARHVKKVRAESKESPYKQIKKCAENVGTICTN